MKYIVGKVKAIVCRKTAPFINAPIKPAGFMVEQGFSKRPFFEPITSADMHEFTHVSGARLILKQTAQGFELISGNKTCDVEIIFDERL